ncbi:hypothetical protein L226DRAFT_288922 [Lentinus tigrinus ALCF2SS1-7]|uniref:uncharacterized protein n=1 Tax=Lentinus tigrinus ALCF2SS1-7 TaxID=1328758 RepID=UPI001165ECB1|nr:hypothetical protein L226DRAFT_288922 [Lentinus tigrinus ALCF2SS1-7]
MLHDGLSTPPPSARPRLVPACLFGKLPSVSIGAVSLGNYTLLRSASHLPPSPVHSPASLGRSDAIVLPRGPMPMYTVRCPYCACPAINSRFIPQQNRQPQAYVTHIRWARAAGAAARGPHARSPTAMPILFHHRRTLHELGYPAALVGRPSKNRRRETALVRNAPHPRCQPVLAHSPLRPDRAKGCLRQGCPCPAHRLLEALRTAASLHEAGETRASGTRLRYGS